MNRISIAAGFLVALCGAAQASTIYSFDGSIGSGDFPGTVPGWDIGDAIHGSFTWDPGSAFAIGSCWGGAISDFTISSQSTTITPQTSGDLLVTCNSSSGLFIESEVQAVSGPVIPPGVLDVVSFLFTGNSGTGSALPADLSAFSSGGFGFQWLHPDTDITGSVQLGARSVPEPASLALLFAGAAGLLFVRRRPLPRRA